MSVLLAVRHERDGSLEAHVVVISADDGRLLASGPRPM
jgi:hypothetical protein